MRDILAVVRWRLMAIWLPLLVLAVLAVPGALGEHMLLDQLAGWVRVVMLRGR